MTMNPRTVFVLLIYTLFMLTSCKKKDIISEHYEMKDNLDFVDELKKGQTCDDSNKSDLHISISHKNKVDLSQYYLLIHYDSIIYYGPYKDEIQVAYCFDGEKSQGKRHLFTIGIIESLENKFKVYSFSRHESFEINKREMHFEFVLLPSPNKFDDNLIVK